jgi:hypothetical protein
MSYNGGSNYGSYGYTASTETSKTYQYASQPGPSSGLHTPGDTWNTPADPPSCSGETQSKTMQYAKENYNSGQGSNSNNKWTSEAPSSSLFFGLRRMRMRAHTDPSLYYSDTMMMSTVMTTTFHIFDYFY